MKGEIIMEDNVKINDKMEDIRRILEEKNYRYVYNDEGDFFMMPAVLENELKNVTFCIHPREYGLLIYCFSCINADTQNPKILNTMMEFICRANYGLIHGNFELEPETGTIRYKTVLNCTGQITEEMLIREIDCHITMFDRYSPGIINILSGKRTSAERELRRCEHPDEILEDDPNDDYDIFDNLLEIKTDIFSNNDE